MKRIILSNDGDSVIYSVPDIVAENLGKYCLKFSNRLYNNKPKKYWINGAMCFGTDDFIAYLNDLFPNEQSKFLLNIGWTNLDENIPEKYKDLPYFNF